MIFCYWTLLSLLHVYCNGRLYDIRGIHSTYASLPLTLLLNG